MCGYFLHIYKLLLLKIQIILQYVGVSKPFSVRQFYVVVEKVSIYPKQAYLFLLFIYVSYCNLHREKNYEKITNRIKKYCMNLVRCPDKTQLPQTSKTNLMALLEQLLILNSEPRNRQGKTMVSSSVKPLVASQCSTPQLSSLQRE